MGMPVDPAPLVALSQAVFAPYPACASVDWEAAMGSGCSMQEALSIAAGTCPRDCQNLLSSEWGGAAAHRGTTLRTRRHAWPHLCSSPCSP